MFDDCAQAFMLYDERKEVWITSGGPQSFRAKGEFVKAKGLRGLAAYEAYGELDDVMLETVRSRAELSYVDVDHD